MIVLFQSENLTCIYATTELGLRHEKLLNCIAGSGSSHLGVRSTIAITFTRLFLVQPIGLVVVMTADRLGFLPPNDKMFRFVLLLQQSMPSSILAGNFMTLLQR